MEIKIVYGSSYIGGLVKEVGEGIKNGVQPYLHTGIDIGGTYSFGNGGGKFVAVVKPTDEEPGAPNNPHGQIRPLLPGFCRPTRIGESAYREVAAYLLDHHHFARVPMTALVEISHSTFNINDDKLRMREAAVITTKTASLQQIVRPADRAFQIYRQYGASNLEACVRRMGILDIRICNIDRHGSNTNLRRMTHHGQGEVIPYDNGLCLPEALRVTVFVWSEWPQASTPFTEDELEYIRKLDPFADADMLRKELPCMIPESSLRVLVVCTIFLKEVASFGFCLSEIGDFMFFVKPFSKLQLVCLEVKTSLLPPSTSHLEETTTTVSFADMDEDVWSLFLEAFPPALRLAFHNHVAKT